MPETGPGRCGRRLDLALTGWPPYDQAMPWGADTDDRERLDADLAALGGRSVRLAGDLTDPMSPVSVFDRAESALGAITFLVVVQTHDTDGGLMDITADDFDRHMAVNARATLLLAEEFARRSGAAQHRPTPQSAEALLLAARPSAGMLTSSSVGVDTDARRAKRAPDLLLSGSIRRTRPP